MRKNGKRFSLVVLLYLSIFIAGCASVPAGTDISTVALTVNPGPNESVIVVQRERKTTGSAISMKVWVNGEEKSSSIRNGQMVQLIIPNGEHTIQAGGSSIERGNEVMFSVNKEIIFFSAKPQVGLVAPRFRLTQTGKRTL